MKTGWQTTEFWKSLIAQISGLAVILHVVNNDDVTTLNNSVATIVEGVFAIVASVGSLAIYVRSRTQLKLEDKGQSK